MSGYEAYASFYERTGYHHQAERREKRKFHEWAEAVTKTPKALVFGGYASGALVSVSVSYWVQDTLLYITHFSHTAALRQGASEVMFHSLREMASQTSEIRQIFVRRYQGGNGMDQYYMQRGAKLVHKPARLQMHPAMRWALKRFRPNQYAILQGTAGVKK